MNASSVKFIASVHVLIVFLIIVGFVDVYRTIGQTEFNDNIFKSVANHRSLLSDANEPSMSIEMDVEEQNLCIVCMDKQKNDDHLYIAWTEEEWKAMAQDTEMTMHFPDCHGSELCSGCLVKIVCDAKGECPKCKRRPWLPPSKVKRNTYTQLPAQTQRTEQRAHAASHRARSSSRVIYSSSRRRYSSVRSSASTTTTRGQRHRSQSSISRSRFINWIRSLSIRRSNRTFNQSHPMRRAREWFLPCIFAKCD
eukprot:156369_1